MSARSELYDRIGVGYAEVRRPDVRIAAGIRAALGAARRVVNVGAGCGAYEPPARDVVAVEPTRDYFPEIHALDRQLFPTMRRLERALGPCEIAPLPIPHDCTDGFLGAYWCRPHAYLDAGVRRGISTFTRPSRTVQGFGRLRRDLESGAWRRTNEDLLSARELDLGYRLVATK